MIKKIKYFNEKKSSNIIYLHIWFYFLNIFETLFVIMYYDNEDNLFEKFNCLYLFKVIKIFFKLDIFK